MHTSGGWIWCFLISVKRRTRTIQSYHHDICLEISGPSSRVYGRLLLASIISLSIVIFLDKVPSKSEQENCTIFC
jgi:hypothetical protein